MNISLSGTMRSPLRVGMLVGSISVAGGGVGEAVRALSHALAKRRTISIDIFTLACDSENRCDCEGFSVDVQRTLGPASFGYAPGLLAALLRSDLDIVHVHGLWMYPSIAARRWSRATARPYIVSPHGMLDPWALQNSGIKKQLARRLYEDAHLRGATCLHALCKAEAEAIREAGFPAPVCVVPNGVALPANGLRKRLARPAGPKVLLFLGRITPKKKVLELIKAFSRTHQAGKDWQLRIVGPVDADYRPVLEEAVAGSPCRDRIHIPGAAYGDARAHAYASADAFVLPSISEGLPMAALEAFASGLPALLTPQCNLPKAFEACAAVAIEPNEDAIAGGLRKLFAMTDGERADMGGRAENLVRETFDWNAVAGRMERVYQTLAYTRNIQSIVL